ESLNPPGRQDAAVGASVNRPSSAGSAVAGHRICTDLDVLRNCRRAAVVLAFGMTALGVSRCSRKAPTPPDVSAALQAAVSAKAPAFAVEDGERGHHLWQEEQRFYRQNGYQLVWTSGNRPRSQMDGLIRGLRALPEEGLDPADYHVDDLETLRRTPLPRDDREK